MRRSGSGTRTDSSSEIASSSPNCLVTSRWVWIASVICLPIFSTGLSEVIGSWKTIAMLAPQKRRISLGDASPISSPSKRIDPRRTTCLRGSSPMTERESTVLPDPDSPTMPSVRPRSRVNDTPSTERTSPRMVSKPVSTSVTSSSGAPGRASGNSVADEVVVTASHTRLPARRSGPGSRRRGS